jgi:signal transduction histidine kinase
MESCVLALRDVTEERRQQELRMGFLMMVSHKLRTPLTVLIACLDLCRRLPAGRGATQLAEVLQVCDVEVQKLGETVAKLLDFKAASQRDVDGEVETAEVGPVLAGACEAVSRHHPERQVRLEVRVAPSVQQVACGPEHLSLVLEKLLDNAVKFGDKDPARVAVVAEPGEPGWVRVSVTDNGPGIPHEYFDRIFEPFVQIEDLPTGQVPGLGVGLAMARQVVSAFGGTVSVQSRLGEGSTFTFTLPSAGSLG